MFTNQISRHMKQNMLDKQGGCDRDVIIVADFKLLLSVWDKTKQWALRFAQLIKGINRYI